MAYITYDSDISYYSDFIKSTFNLLAKQSLNYIIPKIPENTYFGITADNITLTHKDIKLIYNDGNVIGKIFCTNFIMNGCCEFTNYANEWKRQNIILEGTLNLILVPGSDSRGSLESIIKRSLMVDTITEDDKIIIPLL